MEATLISLLRDPSPSRLCVIRLRGAEKRKGVQGLLFPWFLVGSSLAACLWSPSTGPPVAAEGLGARVVSWGAGQAGLGQDGDLCCRWYLLASTHGLVFFISETLESSMCLVQKVLGNKRRVEMLLFVSSLHSALLQCTDFYFSKLDTKNVSGSPPALPAVHILVLWNPS